MERIVGYSDICKGRMMQNYKTAYPSTTSGEFTDAKRPEIALRDVVLWVLEGGLAVLE